MCNGTVSVFILSPYSGEIIKRSAHVMCVLCRRIISNVELKQTVDTRAVYPEGTTVTHQGGLPPGRVHKLPTTQHTHIRERTAMVSGLNYLLCTDDRGNRGLPELRGVLNAALSLQISKFLESRNWKIKKKLGNKGSNFFQGDFPPSFPSF